MCLHEAAAVLKDLLWHMLITESQKIVDMFVLQVWILHFIFFILYSSPTGGTFIKRSFSQDL